MSSANKSTASAVNSQPWWETLLTIFTLIRFFNFNVNLNDVYSRGMQVSLGWAVPCPLKMKFSRFVVTLI